MVRLCFINKTYTFTLNYYMYSKEQIEETFKEICNGLESGLSLRKVLLSESMPSSQTFYKWLDADESKTKQYARSCSKRADVIFEECLAIADDQEEDIFTTDDGKEIVNYNVINRARLRVDTRKWMLGKMNPKKYSDKIQVDTTEFKEQPLFPDVQKNDSDK